MEIGKGLYKGSTYILRCNLMKVRAILCSSLLPCAYLKSTYVNEFFQKIANPRKGG